MDEVRQIDPPSAAMSFIVRDDMYGNMHLTRMDTSSRTPQRTLSAACECAL
jgi:hypothetical protein